MTATGNRSGLFRTVLDAILESRQRQADRHVSGVLHSLDDETLASLGYRRSELGQQANSNRTRS